MDPLNTLRIPSFQPTTATSRPVVTDWPHEPTSSPDQTPVDRVTLFQEPGESFARDAFLLKSFAKLRRVPAPTSPAPAQAPAPAARPDPHFQYDARPIKDYRGSVKWSPGSSLPSGATVNDRITKDYDHLNREMQRYFAGDPKGEKLPPVNDFAGLAKYGSRLAGEQIRNLEDVQKGMHGDPYPFWGARRRTLFREVQNEVQARDALFSRRHAWKAMCSRLSRPGRLMGSPASGCGRSWSAPASPSRPTSRIWALW